MAILGSDDFNRANAGTLGANWNADTDSDWNLVSNQAQSQTVGGWLRSNTGLHADTADVKVSVLQVSASGDGGPTVRCTAVQPSPTGYVLFISSSSPGANVFRTNAGVDTQLGSGAAITHAANKVCALEVSGTGGTVTVKSYYDGVLKETLSDTDASRLTTAGRTGLVSWSGIGTNSTYDDFVVEDAAGGGGGGPVVPVFMNQYRQRRN